MSVVVQRLRLTTPTRRWVGVGAAVLGWFALHEVKLPLWDWLVYDVAGLAPASRLGSGVHFFYGSIKIALLAGIIFLVTVLRLFMSVERTRALLGGTRGRRQRDGRPTRGDYPVLLVQRRACVHRLRRRQGPARGHPHARVAVTQP